MHKILISLYERALYECALAVENDEILKKDLAAWEIAIEDGLKTETKSKKKQAK